MEANWPAIILLSVVTATATYIGRAWFKRWFNPLSLYSAIWGVCLITYELRLIQYYTIGRQAWVYIFVAWLSFYFGSAIVRLADGGSKGRNPTAFLCDLRRLKVAILILSAVGGVGLLDQARVVSGQLGGLFVAVFLDPQSIYLGRTGGELSWLPYAGSFLFPACSFAGIYSAKLGRISKVATLPLLLVALQMVLGMARMGFVMGAILFLSSFLHTPKPKGFTVTRTQLILVSSAVVILLVGGMFFVTSIRGLAVDLPGRTPTIDSITEYIPFFPAVYANFSAPPVALSMYLEKPDEQRNGFWGMYTFAPVFRVLSKFGFPTSVPPYEENYYTPVEVNTSTYLKNLSSDFGFLGVVFFPLLLGAATTHLVRGGECRPKLVGLVVLSDLYVLVAFSYVVNLTVGDWYVATVIGVLAAHIVQRKSVSRLVEDDSGILRLPSREMA